VDANLNRRKTKVLLGLGFGGLLLLVAVLGLSGMTFLYQVEVRQERLRRDYVERDRTLGRLRTDVYLGGTHIRDLLLNPDNGGAAATDFEATRANGEKEIENSRKLTRAVDRTAFEQLRRELLGYFETLAEPLGWTEAERRLRAYRFTEDVVLPRRMAAIGVIDRLQGLSDSQMEDSAEDVSRMFASFRVRFLVLLTSAAAIGLALAGISMWRLLELERVSGEAREELKSLSAKLLSAQEEERRRISRELHDEVGQLLSAMMLGLGNLRASLRRGDTPEALHQCQLVEEMTGRNAKMVRNLSLVLRPTMLDDLGLVPALVWLAREMSRNESIQIQVDAAEIPDDLPEEQRTCVYRVVQEALRNASRHSGATHATVRVQKLDGSLHVSVEDDGHGFNPMVETGLGILGMEERIIRLGGRLHVTSSSNAGTTIRFELPFPAYEMSPLRTA
jgi:signal transduction histidine kinase